MPGDTPEARRLAAKWAEARAWAEIYRSRTYETRHRHRYLIAPRRQWLDDSDLVEDPREVRVALDYDLKRMPVKVGESEGCLCIEATRPWRDRAEFRAWRDDLDLWRGRHRRVLGASRTGRTSARGANRRIGTGWYGAAPARCRRSCGRSSWPGHAARPGCRGTARGASPPPEAGPRPESPPP